MVCVVPKYFTSPVSWNAGAFAAGLDAAAVTAAFFTVKWGQTSGGPYPNVHATPDGATASYTIAGLTQGTWYVVVTQTDALGNESDPSYEDARTIG